jgi:hypothetical protein
MADADNLIEVNDTSGFSRSCNYNAIDSLGNIPCVGTFTSNGPEATDNGFEVSGTTLMSVATELYVVVTTETGTPSQYALPSPIFPSSDDLSHPGPLP